MADFDRDYDPINADYDHDTVNDAGLNGACVGGLIALSSLAIGAGVGAFFTYAAAEVGEALSISYTVGGTTIEAGGTAMTSGEATILAALEAPGMSGAGATLLELIADSGFTALWSVEGLIALSDYHIPTPFAMNYGNFGGYLGTFDHMGGGLVTPPGFPGFPANTVYGIPHLLCFAVNYEDQFCYWER